MKKFKKIFKYKSLLFLSLLIVFGIFVGTFAYFHNAAEVNQEINNNYIEILMYSNNDVDTWGQDKMVGFKSTGASSNPILLRFKYSEMWNYLNFKVCDYKTPKGIYNYQDTSSYQNEANNAHNGISVSNPLYSFVASLTYTEKYSYSNKINGQDVVTKYWSNDFEDNFVLNDDGWYYYKKTLDPSEMVIVLNGYELNNNLLEGTKYYDIYNYYAKYDLLFDFEGLELNTDNVQNAWGINYSVNQKNVTWSFEG